MLFLKKISSVVLFLLLLLVDVVHPQISPGPLSKAHLKLEGISNCTKCHVLGEKVENVKCLACHTEIQSLISQNKGYHGNPDIKKQSCTKCHGEHFGRDFNIVHFDEKNFNHSKTGFVLKGKHKDVKCSDCHKKEFISDKKLRKKAKTFLGLSEKCSSCHKDYHQNRLGKNCEKCHDENSFVPAHRFNHNDARFKLTGAHKKVDCVKCHPVKKNEGVKTQFFKGIKFSSCTSCHKDIHEGKFGSNCEKCHTTVSFAKIKKTNEFDHSKTNFPLKGKHKTVKCYQCHGKKFKAKIKYKQCSDCHSDFHKGELIRNGVNPDCANCHNVSGFSNYKFGIEEHNQTEFKLTGSHLAVPCSSCHKTKNKTKTWKFKFSSFNCLACHENIHKNFMSEKYVKSDNCSFCHSTESWNKIKFDHSVTQFALEGKHKNVPCSDCHLKTNGNKKIQIFKTLTNNCTQCHEDIHLGQFIKENKNNCSDCHTFENWKPTKFDHNKTKFKLTGAHAKLQCMDCHIVDIKNDKKFIKYKLEKTSCESCHS